MQFGRTIAWARPALAAALLALSLAPAPAAQNSLVMPTVGPHGAADLMGNYVNPALVSILSNYSGSSSPTVGTSGAPAQYQFWFDTSVSPPVLRLYDGASWVGIGSLNTSTHLWTGFSIEAVNPQSAAYTIAASDCGKLVSINVATANITALPQATGSFATCWFDIFNKGAGITTLTPSVSTINSQANLNLGSNNGLRIVSDGANWQLASTPPASNGNANAPVNTITVSGATAIQDTTSFLSGCQDYEVVFENIIPGTNGSTIELLLHANGAYQATNYLNAGFTAISNASVAGFGQTTYIQISPVTVVSNVTAYGGMAGSFKIFNVAQTASAKHLTYATSNAYTSASYSEYVAGQAMWPTSGTAYAVDGFEIIANAGGTLSGTVKTYCKN